MPTPVTAPTALNLNHRQELFAYHVARGASLAQAARLAGYSPQGARQRGSVLMANSDIRVRVEEIRHDYLARRQQHVAEAVERVERIILQAFKYDRSNIALKAVELQLRLRGIDSRENFYKPSPDDDLGKVLYDPQEDEDPPFQLLPGTPLLPESALPIEPSPESLPAAPVHPNPEPATAAPQSPAPAKPRHAAGRSTQQPAPTPATAHQMPPVPPALHNALIDYRKTLRNSLNLDPLPDPLGKS